MNRDAESGLPIKSNMKLRFSDLRRKKLLTKKFWIKLEIQEFSQHIVIKNNSNTDRALGARISGELSYLFGLNNFKGSIQLRLSGVAGQSFGAFLTKGIELRLKGLANDYIGKSMSSELFLLEIRVTNEKEAQYIDWKCSIIWCYWR